LLDTNLQPEEVPEIGEDEEVLDAEEVLKAIKRGEPPPETEAPQTADISKQHPPKRKSTKNPDQLDMLRKEKSAAYLPPVKLTQRGSNTPRL
jgi:hypothetical protein